MTHLASARRGPVLQEPSHAPRSRGAARLVALTCSLIAGLAGPAAASFGFENVIARAQELAGQSYSADRPNVPEWLTKLSYDQWRDIRFRPEHALWREQASPFQIQLFHPGLYYNQPVKLNVIEGGEVRPLGFSPGQFDYGRNDFASRVPQDLGFAGFRVHAPIKTARYFDEVLVFLGASYFRGVGRNQGFGLSARALAIDTASPRGEEFPAFREFWLDTPAPDDETLTAYALLDSPRMTGAYRFLIRPGLETTMDVEAFLFSRGTIEKLGVAPLTSMFFHGENSTRHFDDFRPEAHDSDGLLIHFDSGEWLWRPLDNHGTLQVTRFAASSPRGYGIIQRDRDFASYQDLETRYESRPSAWVEPIGDWGKGAVELVEIPTKSDTNDNVVTYWVPEQRIEPGAMLEFAYRLSWYGDEPERPAAGRAVATRRDKGSKGDLERFVVDFAGPALREVPAGEILHGKVSAGPEEGAAELLGQNVVKNPVTGDWRLTFQVRPLRNQPIELRAFLDKGGHALTETWTYTLMP